MSVIWGRDRRAVFGPFLSNTNPSTRKLDIKDYIYKSIAYEVSFISLPDALVQIRPPCNHLGIHHKEIAGSHSLDVGLHR